MPDSPITQQQALEALDAAIAYYRMAPHAESASVLRSFILQHGDAAGGPSDAQMLDWLEAHNGAWCGDSETPYMYHGADWTDRHITEGPSFRAAIASAMKKESHHE